MKKAELLAEQSRLLALANELSRKHWGVDYTGTFALGNRRWRQYNGMYVFNKAKDLREIRMDTYRNAERTPEEVEMTLLHELVHWRLREQGVPSLDTDDEFIAECLRVGASISKVSSAQKAYRTYMQKRAFEELAEINYDDAAQFGAGHPYN
jgi:SprT-like protein